MAQFNITFQVQGIGPVDLPVTPLDNLIVLVNGLEVKTFRFSVQNTLATVIAFDVAATKTGSAAGKVTIDIDNPAVSIEAGQSAIITATITPTQPLLEGDVVDVAVAGTQV